MSKLLITNTTCVDFWRRVLFVLLILFTSVSFAIVQGTQDSLWDSFLGIESRAECRLDHSHLRLMLFMYYRDLEFCFIHCFLLVVL